MVVNDWFEGLAVDEIPCCVTQTISWVWQSIRNVNRKIPFGCSLRNFLGLPHLLLITYTSSVTILCQIYLIGCWCWTFVKYESSWHAHWWGFAKIISSFFVPFFPLFHSSYSSIIFLPIKGATRYGPVDFSGTIYVKDSQGSDYLGVVFGYQSNRKFYVVMWRRENINYGNADYNTGIKGLQLKVNQQLSLKIFCQD